VVHVIGDML
jgi:cation diffusion facilitator family transporter